ncbi:MAG: CvpA family protein [Oceanococcaceae bacterium]
MIEGLVWTDIVLASVLLVSALIGLFRGFVKEVFSLASWVLAVWVAIQMGPAVAERWLASIDSPTARMGAAYVGVFLLVLIAGAILAHMLTLLVARTHLQGTDRSLGLVFGLLRGGVIVAALVLLAAQTTLPRETWWQESAMIPHFERLADWIAAQLPEGWIPALEDVAQPAAAGLDADPQPKQQEL